MPTRLSCFTEEQEDAIIRMIRKEVKKISKEKEDHEQRERERKSASAADYNRKLIYTVHLHHVGSIAKAFIIKIKKQHKDKIWATQAASDVSDLASRICRATVYKYPTLILIQESLAEDLDDHLQKLQCFSIGKNVRIFSISPDADEKKLMSELDKASKELIKMLPGSPDD